MASSPTRQRIDPQSFTAHRTCETGKVRFDFHFQALDAAEFLMDKGMVDPGCHQTPYPCQKCGGWHVGNRVIVFPADDYDYDLDNTST